MGGYLGIGIFYVIAIGDAGFGYWQRTIGAVFVHYTSCRSGKIFVCVFEKFGRIKSHIVSFVFGIDVFNIAKSYSGGGYRRGCENEYDQTGGNDDNNQEEGKGESEFF